MHGPLNVKRANTIVCCNCLYFLHNITNLGGWDSVLYCIYYAFIRSIHMDIEFVQVYMNLQLQLGCKTTT